LALYYLALSMEKIGRVMILSDKGIISKSVHAVKAEHSTAQHIDDRCVISFTANGELSLSFEPSAGMCLVLIPIGNHNYGTCRCSPACWFIILLLSVFSSPKSKSIRRNGSDRAAKLAVHRSIDSVLFCIVIGPFVQGLVN
jgi:hypothetical protein